MKTLTLLAAMSLLLAFVWERVDIVRLGYHIERLKSDKVRLERERDELQVRVSSLTSPARIAKVATEKLGMIPPRQDQVVLVRLEPETPSPAAPAEVEIRLAKSDALRRVR